MAKVLTFNRSTELCSHLTRQVVQLREAKELLDFTLLTDGTAIPCHRLVLAANSPMLRALLFHDSSKSTYLNIPYKVLVNVVNYMYTGVANLPVELLQETLEACDYLDLAELMKQCANAATEHLTPRNVISWSHAARKLNMEHHLQACQSYLFKNILQVIVQDDFHRLSEAELQDLLTCSGKVNVNGGYMLMAVLEWVNTDPKVRTGHIQQYLTCFCPDDCSNEMLNNMMTKYEELFEINNILKKIALKILMKKSAIDQPKLSATSDCDRTIQLPETARLCDEITIIGGYPVTGERRENDNVNTTILLLKDDNLIKYSTLPSGVSSYHSVCSVPGGFVLTGGKKSKICTIFLYKTKQWVETTPMPAIRYGHASLFVDGLVFVLGGYINDGSQSCSVGYLDLKTSKWQGGPQIPTGKCNAVAATLNQTLFVMNKYDDCLNSLDSRNMRWSRHRKMYRRNSIVCMCAGADKLFVLGDDGNILWYMVDIDDWCRGKLRLPRRIRYTCGMSFYNNRVIVLIGNKVFELDTDRNVCKDRVTLTQTINDGFIFFSNK